MALYILLALIGVPLIEIATFIQVGDRIGLWATLAVVILTAILGTFLLRRQGMDTIRRAQMNLERGDMPLAQIFDGVFLLIAGVLLLTPGFVTDGVGFLLFIPQVRAALRHFLLKRLIQSGDFRVHGHDIHSEEELYRHTRGAAHHRETVIDGEFTVVEEDGEDDEKEGKKSGPTNSPSPGGGDKRQ